ncbi:MAG: hypothetical protein AAGF77_07660 [Bacteroidota bacterium]
MNTTKRHLGNITKKRVLSLSVSLVCFLSLTNAYAIEIHLKNSDPAVAYAASDLTKYLSQMGFKDRDGVLQLGLFDDFLLEDTPSVVDKALDDAIVVSVKGTKGFIAGSNPRSVLLGVYRFLETLGCYWNRPGEGGAYIPNLSETDLTVSLNETATHRNRIFCIEDAVSLTNVREFIEWMPKVGFNGFMTQFKDNYTFFDRWYSHESNNEKKRNLPISREMSIEFSGIITEELKKRGLLHHAVGHGWTTEAYGIPALGWMMRFDYTQEFLDNIALVDGQRTVPWNIPTLAALRYADDRVQDKLVAHITEYAQNNQGVDYLHVWLEDGSNGKSEDELSRATSPTDHYFQILNKLDTALKNKGLKTKIVFIAYNQLLWKPLEEQFNDSSRFTFLFASSRRDYNQSLKSVKPNKSLPKFKLNRIPSDFNTRENIVGFMHSWKEFFEGDRIIFEYYRGAPTIERAKAVSNDIQNLKKLGFNGLINCHGMRSFFPNGFGNVVLGKTLWNGATDFKSLSSVFFSKTYGTDGMQCFNFLEQSQAAIAHIENTDKKDRATINAILTEIEQLIIDFKPVVQRNLQLDTSKDKSTALSWKLMENHVKVLEFYHRYKKAQITDNGQGASTIRHRFQQFVFGLESDYQPYIFGDAFFHRFMPRPN